MKTLAERLVWARMKIGLSQAALAKMAGVTQSTIGNLESGARLTARKITAIADALGVNPAWLAEGIGKPIVDRLAENLASSPDNIELKIYWPDDEMKAMPAGTISKMVVPIDALKELVKFTSVKNLALTMAPESHASFSKGDMLLIDFGVAALEDGGIYGLSNSDGEFHLRRVDARRLDGNIHLISGRKNSDSEILTPDRQKNIRILYRVLTSLQWGKAL